MSEQPKIEQDKYSLSSFLSLGRIVIPMIQRDYAQGRIDKKVTAIRESFLKDIVCCLCGVKKNLDLDFVFGSVEKDAKTGATTVLPIDGQQRLTTLFLVHWYFGAFSHQDEHSGRVVFSYVARRMASQFVAELCASEYNWSAKDVKSPELWVAEQKWFCPIWRSDATVSGMLTTLRTLHSIVVNRKIWMSEVTKSLEEVGSPDPENLRNITFYFDPMDDVNVDEGYRKMNARGRALSDWENIRSVVEEGVNKEGFDQGLRNRWMTSVSGEWVSAMESFLPELNFEGCDDDTDGEYLENVDAVLDKQTERFNEGFRNLLDLAVYLYAVRSVDDEKERYLAIARGINLGDAYDGSLLDRFFGERWKELGLANDDKIDELTSLVLCGKIIPKEDWAKSMISAESRKDSWGEEVWKGLLPIVLDYYEKLFRQHNASSQDYERWVVSGVIECAVDFYDALIHHGEGKYRGWNRIDRARCLDSGWKSEDKRGCNWFWDLKKEPQNAPDSQSENVSDCKFEDFCSEVLFVRTDSQKSAADNVTAVRFYVLAKALSQELTSDREYAVRHLYNLLDNQESIEVTVLGKTLKFVDELFNSRVGTIECDCNEQERCLDKYSKVVFLGCKFQMEEEIVKSRCNRRGDLKYLQYEKDYSKLNGMVGFLVKPQSSGFDEALREKFNEVVWCNGIMPRQAFFEVTKAITEKNFPATNVRKLRIPTVDGDVKSWKSNLTSPLWRQIFIDYESGVVHEPLPEITFMLGSDPSIFAGMSYLWRHQSDGRFYLSKTSGRLTTYVWLTYTSMARAIMDAVKMPYATNNNATWYSLDSIECNGWMLDISPALNSREAVVRLRNKENKLILSEVKFENTENTDSMVDEIKRAIRSIE